MTDSARTPLGADIETAYAYHQAGQYDQAKAMYRHILNIHPDEYNALQLLGVIALHDGDFHTAIELIGRAVEIIDTDASAYNNLGEAYRNLDRLADAELCFRRALSIDCRYAIAYNNLAVVLQRLNRPDQAEDACRTALHFSPYYPEAWNNLGIILASRNKMDEAEAAYWQALKVRSDYVAPYVNLGILYKNIGRFKESEHVYNNALLLNPHEKDAQYNLSILLLLQGKLQKGFELYENRSEKQAVLSGAPQRCPLWQGEPLNGKTLLIITEQGAGDALMMMRFLRVLKKTRQPESIGIHCDASLQRVFSAFPEVNSVFSKLEPPPFGLFDRHCSMMSLPFICKTTLATIPREIPYISVPPDIEPKWQKTVLDLRGLKVGLVWAGNKDLDADEKRSIPLRVFKPLTEISGVHFFSLQKGDGSEQLKECDWGFIDVMDKCEDFLDTAVLIRHLDLVISVDTSVAHLAGAMGKPVWLLNRYESEWRWMLDRSDSPWYSSMKIFRQSKAGDWNGVMRRVAHELSIMSEPFHRYVAE